MLPRAVLTINMMCRHLFGFSATTRATGALAAFTGTAVAAGGIPTACAFTGSACAIGGSAVVLYSGNGGAAMLVPVFEQGSPWSTAAAGRCVGVGSPSSMTRLGRGFLLILKNMRLVPSSKIQ